MRTWIGTAVAGLLIAFSVTVYGAKPDREPEAPADVVFPAGSACSSFDVRIQTETRGFVKVFASGELQSSGYERAWVTNLSSGKQLELLVNGRVHIVFPNGGEGEIVVTGPQIFVFFPGDAGPGNEAEARMYYFKGHARAVIDDFFTFLEFEFFGKSMDLCAALN